MMTGGTTNYFWNLPPHSLTLYVYQRAAAGPLTEPLLRSMSLTCEEKRWNAAGPSLGWNGFTIRFPAGWWLVYPSEKYESIGMMNFPIYGKIKNVPNQTTNHLSYRSFVSDLAITSVRSFHEFHSGSKDPVPASPVRLQSVPNSRHLGSSRGMTIVSKSRLDNTRYMIKNDIKWLSVFHHRIISMVFQDSL